MNDGDPPETKPRPKGRPSRYRNARGSIINAAVQLFTERGFEGSSIGEVAKLAGVPKATVGYYFSSKDELWKHAIDKLWADVDSHFRSRITKGLTPDMRSVRQLFATYLEACRKFPGYTRVPAIEGGTNNWRSRWIAEHHLKRHMDSLTDYWRQLVARGVAPADLDPLVVQLFLAGAGNIYFGQQALWQAAAAARDPDRVMDEVLDTLGKLLDRGSAREEDKDRAT